MKKALYDARLPQLRVTPEMKSTLEAEAASLGVYLTELMRRKLSAPVPQLKPVDSSTMEAIQQ